MTQIFTGSGLGLHGSSLGQLGGYGPKGVAGLGQGGESVYVNGANGNLVLKQSDGFLATPGFGLDIFQIYNSRGEGGSAWRFNTDSCLECNGTPNTAGSIIKRTDEDGHCSRYIYDESQQAYLAEDGTTTRLTFHDGIWQYREGCGQTSCNYNAEGQLTTLSDRDGHMLRFSYQNGQLASITDTLGKQTVTWSFNQGLLRDVTWVSDDKIAHHLHYDYDGHHRLNKVSRDLNDGTMYWIAYDYSGDSNLISDIRQSDGTKLHIDYDAEGRVKRLVDGEGRTTTYQYLVASTIVTNGLGESWTYSYDKDAQLTTIDGPEHFHVHYYYEGKRLVSITQGNQRWQLAYNDAGDCVRIDSPTGEVTKRTFDNEHRILSETRYQTFDNDHHPQRPITSRFVYDEQGHLSFEITPDGTVTEHRYNAEGLRISSRCYLRAHFDTHPLPEEQSLTRNELIHWRQQQHQQDVSLVDYLYDWRGCLTDEIHYIQVDEQGDGILTNDSLRTYTRYDAAGRLVEKSSLTESGVSTTHYFYDDLGRLIKTIDNQKNEQTIEYDDAHQRIIKTSPNGLQTIYTYDQSGLLLSTQRLDSGHQYGTVTYCYDAAGRLIAETNLEGKTRYFFYDHQGRLDASVSVSGQVTEYLYDEEGHCIQTHQYQQTIDTHSFQGQALDYAEIKPHTSNQDRISHVVYNAYQQIAYQIDADGAVISYQYDAEGRVIAKTAHAKRLAYFLGTDPLKMSDIALVVSNDDRTISYYYDDAGRLKGEMNGEGAATAYRYDNAGHLIERCRYANKVVLPRTGDWGLDAPSITHRQDVHNYSLYNAAGLKVADIDAEGYLTEYCYDARGLRTDTIAYYTNLKSPFTPIDGATIETMRPSQHVNDHHTRYHYDDLNQLIEEKTQSGFVITYAYDEEGQVISKTSTDSKTHGARTLCYRYDALGRVIQRLDELGAARLEQNSAFNQDEIELIWQQHSVRYAYDNAGHLLSKTNALNQTSRYFYNDAGLLTYTLSAAGAVTENRYNAFNQVETTVRYSAYWVGNTEVNTQQLKQYLAATADVHFDEVTYYEYNTLGLVTSKRQGTGGLFSTTYNVFGEVEETMQSNGSNHDIVTNYQYDRRGLLRYRTEDAGQINKAFEAQYDAFGQMEKWLDGRYGATTYQLNKRGEQIRIEDPGHGIKTMTYDAFGRVLSVKSRTEESYTYDDKNNTLTLVHTNTASTVVTKFNAFGDKITITDGNHHTTSYQYDAKGQLTHIDAPENTTTDYTYDNDGELLSQQDASGHMLRYTYDAEGRVLTKMVDPDGLHLTTTYTYDGLGRQLQVIENGRCTRFTYDSQGNLIKKCLDPDGLNLITEYSYTENGRMVHQTTHNPQGTNKVIAYEWDALGRCIATTLDPDGLKLTTTYEYDNNDNIIVQTDANQQRTQYVYDANNRAHYCIDARGVVTEHFYGIKGSETQTITYKNRITTTIRYDEKSLLKAIQPDTNADHYQFFAYDKQSRLIMSCDGLGYATWYTYDANDNLTAKKCYATPLSLSALKNGDRSVPLKNTQDRTTHFVYDGLNQARFQIDANGRVIEYRYDASGQMMNQIRFAHPLSMSDLGTDYSPLSLQEKMGPDTEHDERIQYDYDMAGRLCLKASPTGAITAYQYDEAGNITSTTQYANQLSPMQLATDLWKNHLKYSDHDRTIRAIFDAAGREIYRISATGNILERRYDAAGNVLTEIAHAQALQLTSYTQQNIMSALSVDNMSDHLTRYQYDVADRLLKKIDAEHHTTQYTYDKNNNVATKTDANNACWTYHYDEANQLIESLSPKTTLSTYQGDTWVDETKAIITQNRYDSFGNLITVIHDVGGIHQTVHYTYDGNNRKLDTVYPYRMVSQSNQNTSKARQEEMKSLTETSCYNAFGELVASSDRAGHWRHWAYDNVGHLIYTVDAENSLTQYQYDSFDNLSMKTVYANRLSLKGDSYDVDRLKNATCTSSYDRSEYYTYDKAHRLIESRKDIVNAYNARTGDYHRLSPTSRMTYNTFGEVVVSAVKLTDIDWAITRSYYNLEGLKTASINAEGYLTTYTYNDFCLLESENQYAERAKEWSDESYTLPQPNNKDRKVMFLYDALGQLTSKTLKQVSYQRLTGIRSQYETMTSDLTSHYRYDAMGHVVSTTDAQNNTVYSYYNESGQLTAKVGMSMEAGRSATTYCYDALGQLVGSRQWARGAQEADESHFTLKGAASDDVIMNDVYDLDGHLIVQMDGNRHTVYYSYDANGNIARSWQVLTQADKSEVIQDKQYRYDRENRLTQSAVFKANGMSTTDDATYNAFGEVVAKGTNGVLNRQIDYDLAGRVWRSNMAGYFQIYVYDLSDHVAQVVTSTNAFGVQYDESGVDLSMSTYETAISFNQDKWRYDLQRQDNVYDALGRLLSQTKDGSTSATDKNNQTLIKKATQRQQVDCWGNVVMHTNANDYTTYYTYNAFDQVVKQALPEVKVVDEMGVTRQINPVINYAYDALGHAIAMTDANGHTVAKVLDAEGRVTQETDALGYRRYKSYNILGQLATATNERGGVTTYAYDKANRLLSVTTAHASERYEYDGAGQLISQTLGLNNVTTYAYDALGHQVMRKQADGGVTTYDYDDEGHKTGERDANGNTSSWSYDENGRLQAHTDLGGHCTSYTYNKNGLLLTEQSTSGKNMRYHYFSDGQLEKYEDIARNEFVDYTYDAEGNVLSKESSRVAAWALETDHYQYDAFGRLVQVRRRNPEDHDSRVPDKDHALLSIDYEYDAAGNIRDTKVDANYTGYQHVSREDYFRYDANNRMIINKGQLQNGQIVITTNQGSELEYDETGNINTADKYENGFLQNYTYQYNVANQLEVIRKNGYDFQTTRYDTAGNVEAEYLYNNRGVTTQQNVMSYEKGRLTGQLTMDRDGHEINRTHYDYDGVGNLKTLTTAARAQGNSAAYTQTHQYSYALWDGYQQKHDLAILEVTNQAMSEGHSERIYDVNGQLKEAIDSQIGASGLNNTTQYSASSIDGIRARIDKDGQTSYLVVAGKTIGDLRLDTKGVQHLDVYAGFTPGGTPEKDKSMTGFLQKHPKYDSTLSDFLKREDALNATLPEVPQDNLGAYTLMAGDTLESIALKVYGDSSLWYLLADANGITDRQAHAGEKGSQLHTGQRINIPQAASGQHHTNNTHNVLNSTDIIGNTSATMRAPPTPPPMNNHNNFWTTMAKVVVAVVAVVATVMSAGALGILAVGGGLSGIGAAGISGILAAGTSILGGTSAIAGTALSTSALLTTGFAAGFIGSIAAQGAANAFSLQKGLDLKGALISGLATAATAGVSHALNTNGSYKEITKSMQGILPDAFNIQTAAEMMEKDTLSQSINLALRGHQHFDWLELATNGATAGFMGGIPGQKINQTLNKIDQNTGILSSELQSLATSGTNNHFDAAQILTDNLGNALGSGLIRSNINTDPAAWNNDAYDSLTYHSELLKDWDNGEVNPQFENNALLGSLYGSKSFIFDPNVSVDAMGLGLVNSVSNFYLLQNHIFEHEGSMSHHPNDAGGYTNKGITFATFEQYAQIDVGVKPTLDNLKKLTNEQASVIYKKRFWDPIKADDINSLSLAYSLYDFHVNAPGQAVKLMQKSVNFLGGELVIDNKMGSKTIKAINGVDAHKLFDVYQQKKIDYYTQRVIMIPTQRVFLNGWLNRINNIKFEK